MSIDPVLEIVGAKSVLWVTTVAAERVEGIMASAVSGLIGEADQIDIALQPFRSRKEARGPEEKILGYRSGARFRCGPCCW